MRTTVPSPLALTTLLALSACGSGSFSLVEDPLDDACPALVLGVERVVLSDVYFDQGATGELLIRNDCMGSAELVVGQARVEGDASPYIPAEGEWRVPAGASLQLPVRYDPTDYGPHIASVHLQTNDPDNPELVVVFEGQPARDQDLDGFEAAAVGGADCDDLDPAVYPGKTEARDLVDQDCDGLVDEDFIREGDAMISEIMVAPRGRAVTAGQWFEVRNLGNQTVDMVGWTLQAGGTTLTVSNTTLVEPGAQALLTYLPTADENGAAAADGILRGGPVDLASDWSLDLTVGGRVVHPLDGSTFPDLAEGASLQLDGLVDDAFQATRGDLWCLAVDKYNTYDRGTPGESNALCSQVDHDGDGLSADRGDCDDLDPTVSPGLAERWDGKDNDCDGLRDNVQLEDLGAAHAAGSSYLYQGGISSGDLDGDGKPELILVQRVSLSDVYIFDAGDLERLAYDLESSSTASMVGAGAVASPANQLGDVTGDGSTDLVLAIDRSYYGGAGGGGVLIYDRMPSSSFDLDEAQVWITGSDVYGNSGSATTADLDGDGIHEVVFGQPSNDSNRGTVWAASAAGASGAVPVDDLDPLVWRGGTGQMLGWALTGGDVDGDGYADLLMRSGSLYGVQDVYMVLGGRSGPDTGAIGSVSELNVAGLGSSSSYGPIGGAPVLADLEGDGVPDLLVGNPGGDNVIVIFDIGSQSGRVRADATLGGSQRMGSAVSAADLDGDGHDDVVVGAPGAFYGSETGTALFFDGRDIVDGAALRATDALGTVRSGTPGDGFAGYLRLDDFDGDGDIDLAAVASHAGTSRVATLWYLPSL